MEEDDLYRLSNPNFLQSSDIRFRVDGRAASPSCWLSTSTSMAAAAEAELAHVTQLDRRAEIDRQTADHVSDSDPDLIKAQISTHPRYPHLVSAYIECQKVGAPPEFASLLQQLNHQIITLASSHMGAPDPELDDFMESYCEVLHRYKEELSKPFDDATTFLSYMESELNNLCNGSAMAPITRTTPHNFDHSDEAVGSSDEEAISCGEGEIIGIAEGQECWPKDIQEGEHDIRGMLMRKYGGYLGSLRKEFMSKRKKGKLPKDAISALVDWWNLHHRWPYPTEEDKSKLSEITGLDQKQINNWFINQRKRHWKPSQDLKAALLEGLGANRTVDSDHDNGQAHVSQDSILN